MVAAVSYAGASSLGPVLKAHMASSVGSTMKESQGSYRRFPSLQMEELRLRGPQASASPPERWESGSTASSFFPFPRFSGCVFSAFDSVVLNISPL